MRRLGDGCMDNGSSKVDLRTVVPAAPSPVPPYILERAPTLTAAIAELATRHPEWTWAHVLDRDCVEHPVVLGSLWARAGDVAATLLARGVRAGEVVLVIAPTSPELLATYVGILRAGAVPSLLATPGNRYADWTVYFQRIGAIARNAKAAALVATADVAYAFRQAPEMVALTTLLTPDEIGSGVAPPPPPAVNVQALVTLQYSSGATGAAKGIRWRHGTMMEHLRVVRDAVGLDARAVAVNWIPLYHDMGLVGAFLLPLVVGMRSVLIPTMDFVRAPELWPWAVHRHRGTLSWSPNFGYAVCAARLPDDALAGLDLSSWRIAMSASEPVLANTFRAFVERFTPYGLRAAAPTAGWGLAETITFATTPVVDVPPRVETIDRHTLARSGVATPTTGDGLTSVGLGTPVRGCTLEIRDAAGRVLPERHVGNIWVRSTSLFAGYQGEPEGSTQDRKSTRLNSSH